MAISNRQGQKMAIMEHEMEPFRASAVVRVFICMATPMAQKLMIDVNIRNSAYEGSSLTSFFPKTSSIRATLQGMIINI